MKNRALQLARLDNGGLLVVVDLAGAGAGGLEGLDNVQGLLVGDLAEDDVLAIEPAGDDGGDEELRAVAGGDVLAFFILCYLCRGDVCLRVWAGVGHGQKSGLGVLPGEVLIGELLAVDGLATGALG